MSVDSLKSARIEIWIRHERRNDQHQKAPTISTVARPREAARVVEAQTAALERRLGESGVGVIESAARSEKGELRGALELSRRSEASFERRRGTSTGKPGSPVTRSLLKDDSGAPSRETGGGARAQK